jgi:ubiquinone/menaquinone biosynthesis C-methylase UbiE
MHRGKTDLDNKDNFIEKSYNSHESHYTKFIDGGEYENTAQNWCTQGTADGWRHQRLYDNLLPLIERYPGAEWLTVGDGRYGSDAHYLQEKGLNVIATDISDVLLKVAKERGCIKQYQKENAEALSFKDNSFDFVLCKESYHHFPRPVLALYEMLRVAQKGIVFIEPGDSYIDSGFMQIPLRNLKNFARKIIRKRSSKHDFEPVGNYVYRLSRREIEKIVLGINLRTVAFRGMNDYFFKGLDSSKDAKGSWTFLKLRVIIGIQDFLCRLGLIDYTMLVAAIFKTEPDTELRKLLKSYSYKVIDLPRNPYLK